MKNIDSIDFLFRDAVDAIDSGNISSLQNLLEKNPQLVSKRMDSPAEGYFKHPYLLWFVSQNPVRHEKLPPNIVELTRLLIHFVQKNARETFQEQIDYTLGLVETGRILREYGVQIEMIDLLMDNGAISGNTQGALTSKNTEAAKHIIKRNGKITLTAAVCLNRIDEVKKFLPDAPPDDRQVALIAAAFYGNPEIIRLLIKSGVDVNAYIEDGFHTHASPLHQAVASGSLESVKLLLQAGAHPDSTDRIYNGTPLDWAMHMQAEETDLTERDKYREIENYLYTQQNEKG